LMKRLHQARLRPWGKGPSSEKPVSSFGILECRAKRNRRSKGVRWIVKGGLFSLAADARKPGKKKDGKEILRKREQFLRFEKFGGPLAKTGGEMVPRGGGKEKRRR